MVEIGQIYEHPKAGLLKITDKFYHVSEDEFWVTYRPVGDPKVQASRAMPESALTEKCTLVGSANSHS